MFAKSTCGVINEQRRTGACLKFQKNMAISHVYTPSSWVLFAKETFITYFPSSGEDSQELSLA
jgi:hypothetical protein